MTVNTGEPKPIRRARYRQGRHLSDEGQPTVDPYKLLALSILMQAVEDVRGGDGEAATWLKTNGPFFLDACSVPMDPDHWNNWIMAGCPRVKRESRRII